MNIPMTTNIQINIIMRYIIDTIRDSKQVYAVETQKSMTFFFKLTYNVVKKETKISTFHRCEAKRNHNERTA